MGSEYYAEEYAMGQIKQYSGRVLEAAPNRRIVFGLSFPISVLTPRFVWMIRPSEQGSVFTAVTYVRAGAFLHWLLPQAMDDVIASGRLHMREDGENLSLHFEERRGAAGSGPS